jgi:outer membrane lipoprotein LolB
MSLAFAQRLLRVVTAAWLTVLVAACASPPRAAAPAAGEVQVRSGRLAMSVQDQPGQSFSAGFELKGRAEAGELTLFNPIGGTVAVLRWRPGSATLAQPGGAAQEFPSVDAMVQQATGAPLPLAALFDWLEGVQTPVPGWQVDLSSIGEGRLRAKRVQPTPEADLRVVLDR